MAIRSRARSLCLLPLALALSAPAFAAQDIDKVNGSITVEAGQTVGDLDTVNGSIRVAGNGKLASKLETVNGGIFVDRGGDVRGDIETVNGAIGLVDTDLSGGITTVNGDVTVGVDSHVKGGIHYTKPSSSWFSFNKRDPKVIIGPNAVVEGPLKFERKVELYVHSTAKTGAISGATAVRYDGATPPGQ